MIAGDALDVDRLCLRPQPAVLPAQILGEIVEQLVPARLRAEHDREGRIALDVDPIERIHLHGESRREACHACRRIERTA
jgi:hypothetical protein